MQQQRWSAGEPDGEFRHLAGRAIGILYVLSGVITFGNGLTLLDRMTVARTMFAVGVAGVAAGVVMLRLPWHRWPLRAPLVVVAPTLMLLGLSNRVDPDPYLASIFLFLLGMWLGVAQPRGTVLAVSPLFAIAYWWPMTLVPRGQQRAVGGMSARSIAVAIDPRRALCG